MDVDKEAIKNIIKNLWSAIAHKKWWIVAGLVVLIVALFLQAGVTVRDVVGFITSIF